MTGKKTQHKESKKVTSEKPVSLFGASLTEALEALLQIKPEKKNDKKKPEK